VRSITFCLIGFDNICYYQHTRVIHTWNLVTSTFKQKVSCDILQSKLNNYCMVFKFWTLLFLALQQPDLRISHSDYLKCYLINCSRLCQQTDGWGSQVLGVAVQDVEFNAQSLACVTLSVTCNKTLPSPTALSEFLTQRRITQLNTQTLLILSPCMLTDLKTQITGWNVFVFAMLVMVLLVCWQPWHWWQCNFQVPYAEVK